jgi:hypothetical protein
MCRDPGAGAVGCDTAHSLGQHSLPSLTLGLFMNSLGGRNRTPPSGTLAESNSGGRVANSE